MKTLVRFMFIAAVICLLAGIALVNSARATVPHINETQSWLEELADTSCGDHGEALSIHGNDAAGYRVWCNDDTVVAVDSQKVREALQRDMQGIKVN